MSPHRTRIALALLLGGVPAPVAGQQQSAERYLERLPGGVVAVAMRLVDLGEGQRLWVAETEVTWDAYDIYVFNREPEAAPPPGTDAVARPSKPYVVPGSAWGHRGMPALGMTWEGATGFAGWMSRITGRTYRLPTEAEWGAVCRVSMADAGAHAWHFGNAGDRTHPVASLPPDAAGLFDLLGNAAEWAMADDGTAVIRGGAFDDDPEDVHCGARRRQTAAWNASDPQLPKSRWWLPDAPFVSFRLVRDP